MAQIIEFSKKSRKKSYYYPEIKDDYYITISDLALLTDRSEQRIYKDIENGILRADKINGDMLVPMSLADKYIEKALKSEMLLIRIAGAFSIVMLGICLAMTMYIKFVGTKL